MGDGGRGGIKIKAHREVTRDAGRSYAGRDGATALLQVECDGTLHLRIEGMLWIVRSGALWRDLSAVFTLPSFRGPPQTRLN